MLLQGVHVQNVPSGGGEEHGPRLWRAERTRVQDCGAQRREDLHRTRRMVASYVRLLSVLQDQVSPPSDKEEAEAEPAPAKKRKPTSTAAEKATKSKKPRASTTKPSGSSAASRSTKKSKKPARSAVCVPDMFSVAMSGVHVFHPSPSLKVQTRNRARKQGQVVGPKYSPHPRGSA